MPVRSLHHVGVVVRDLEAARDFLLAIGLELEGEADIDGEWASAVVGIPGMRSRIAMLRTPDGVGRIELSTFLAPPPRAPGDPEPADALGLRHLAFPVDDLDATLAVVRALGFAPIGAVQEGGGYRLVYVRGPEGLLVELAEEV